MDEDQVGATERPATGPPKVHMPRALILAIAATLAWGGGSRGQAVVAPPGAGREVAPGTGQGVDSSVVRSPAPDRRQGAETPKTPASPKGPTAADTTPIELQPYRIQLHLVVDPSARIDPALRQELLRDWSALVRRFVGPPWIVTTPENVTPLASGRLESLDAAVLSGFDDAADKVWLVQVGEDGVASGLWFSGREYDTATRRLGPLQRRQCPSPADGPRTLLMFALELFNPSATISGQEGGKALLTVQGIALPPTSPIGRVADKGTVFLPFRRVVQRDGSISILRIPYTYLSVDSVTGPVARCAIVSALSDPFTRRLSRPFDLVALGIKPGDSPLRFRFVTKPDKQPAAGYSLSARRHPDGLPREVGLTDRSGRIVLAPGFADGLVILRLVAGNAEPMVEFPVMPGENSDERLVDFDPRRLAVNTQAKLDALRDQIVDLIALRALLESRMKARLDGEDWNGLDEALKELPLLPPRETFAEQVAKLKEDAARQQAETKQAVLTRNTQAQFNEVQSLIDRYLDNEAFDAYAEALARHRSEAEAKAKEKGKGRTKPAAGKQAVPPSPAAPPGASPAAGPTRPTARATDKPAGPGQRPPM